MVSSDQTELVQQAVRQAAATRTPVNIVAGNSKSFYGRKVQGRELNVSRHCGILNYQPSELVVTARSATRLTEISEILAEQGQMLAFEPPAFATTATLGGIIACGFSGSRRPFAGSARDFVLGCRILDGRGSVLSFGGEVMKNVAGYDVARLMVGALGTLGIVMQVSVKVLPMPQLEMTRTYRLAEQPALKKMRELAGRSIPLSGLSYDGEQLYVRLSGTEQAVLAASGILGGECLSDAAQYWRALQEQTLAFFRSERPLWRISVPPACEPLPLAGRWYYDWGGALRWLISHEPAETIFSVAARAGGHAACFRHGDRNGPVFQPLSGALRRIQRNLKRAFDPHGIFNPMRLSTDW